MWRPLTDEPVPALLEYLPYRLTDWTAPPDHQRHPWHAGHGYASVRVDIRGHANSEGLPTEGLPTEGLPTDEYSTAELADGVEVVNWLTPQTWCDGRVGMFGTSWGGFNSLQIAALAPEPLKAIITVCSTNDRYDNDVHYLGGSVLAVRHARLGGDDARLRRRPPATGSPVRGTRARPGATCGCSVCEDYGAVDAAVLAVDGRRDPVPRHCPAPGGAPARRPRPRPDRPLVPSVPRPRAAPGSRDRLPPGDAALVGPLAHGQGHRRHVRAPAARVRQRLAPPGLPTCGR